MILRSCCAALLGISTLAFTPYGCAADKRPIFADKSFDEAIKASKDGDKLLVVYATAVWCIPCKQMDKTTWRDEKVVKWFERNVVAIQFDVDKQRDMSRKLMISAMPTIIAFKRGEEFDRVVGYKDTAGLIGWLEGVMRGERAVDKLLRQAEGAADDKGTMGMQERLRFARTLARSGEHERALEEFVWLWDNMLKHESSMSGVRVSFMASDMERLAAEYAPAKERFTKMRDALADKIDSPTNGWEDLDDWVVLNEVVGESDKTLKWFDRVKGETDWAPGIQRVSFRLERLLQERGGWKEMALLIRDPLAKLRRDHAMLQRRLNRFRDNAAKTYASLLAADRDDDAQKVAAETIKLDDTPEVRMKLVEFALRANEPRQRHATWLSEASEAGATVQGLQQRLQQLLNGAESAKEP